MARSSGNPCRVSLYRPSVAQTTYWLETLSNVTHTTDRYPFAYPSNEIFAAQQLYSPTSEYAPGSMYGG